MFDRFFKKDALLNTLITAINDSHKISVFGCGKGEKLALLNECKQHLKVFVAISDSEANEIIELLTAMRYRVGAITNPPMIEINNVENVYLKNISTLRKCNNNELDTLVFTHTAMLTKYPSKDKVFGKSLTLEAGETHEFTKLITNLVKLGYVRKKSTAYSGEFSVRGDVIDVFPASSNCAYRIYFDFEEIEKIKQIDTNTFEALSEVDSVCIYKRHIFDIEKEVVLKKIRQIKTKSTYEQELLAKAISVVEHERYKDNYFFLPIIEKEYFNIFSLLPKDTAVFFSDAKMVYDNIVETLKEQQLAFKNEEDGGYLKIHEQLVPTVAEVLSFNDNHSMVAFQNLSNANRLFNPQKVFNLKTVPNTNYTNNLSLLVSDCSYYINENYSVIIYAGSVAGSKQIFNLLNGKVNVKEATNLVQAEKNHVNILSNDFPLSFSFSEEKLMVIGSRALFNTHKKLPTVNTKSEDMFLPEMGDYVVHNFHGVGKSLGVHTLNINNAIRDYVVIEYKNNDKLYLPVENIDSISKFVGSDKAPTINRLGGNDFAKIKERVKSSLKEMAFDLMELYAKRKQAKGFKYSKENQLTTAFANSFPYVETPDQTTAINEINKDMESGKVMDRLLCGDVGFGKTEVALRCAFKTILDKKKVALLCPTTILSEQHYNTALARMQEFGVRIEVLNRFKTPKQTKNIYERLERGEIDIIIGTHKLLNKNIIYNNLGLLILDEEQKFGVEAKEKIKNLKKSINVLALSATPIPRTLHMSMVGIRDISVIETPPPLRLPTQVTVTEYSNNLLKSVIKKELARDGQVLIIYNRVESIYSFKERVQAQIDCDITLDVAHGQMRERDLEKAILKLYNGETQVLIATTLIENGIDLPGANTLIVIDSDMLGLSQLYQLKGRIGRGDRQAYAYFTYNARKVLTENAYKRLEAITEFSSMGSGYKIALRDLEIRGAGNVLGKQQHGHLQRVGYAMYVNLLNQAVQEAKGMPVKTHIEVKIDTSINAHIAVEYIENHAERVAAYMSIAKIDNIEKLKSEKKRLQERYGKLPVEVANLCKIAFVKSLAALQNIVKVVIKKSECHLQFASTADIINEKVSRICTMFSDVAVIKLESLPIIKLNIQLNISDKLDFVMAFLQEFL